MVVAIYDPPTGGGNRPCIEQSSSKAWWAYVETNFIFLFCYFPFFCDPLSSEITSINNISNLKCVENLDCMILLHKRSSKTGLSMVGAHGNYSHESSLYTLIFINHVIILNWLKSSHQGWIYVWKIQLQLLSCFLFKEFPRQLLCFFMSLIYIYIELMSLI